MALPDRMLLFPLTNQQSRLLFEYDTGNAVITMMYDSGAQIPVWCTGEDVLSSAYPDAVRTDYYCLVSGFGKDAEKSPIFIIPRFQLSDSIHSYTIRNLYIAALMKPSIGCDLLISETMLSKTDTTIIRRGERSLRIDFSDLDRDYQCTALRREKDLRGIAVWTEIET